MGALAGHERVEPAAGAATERRPATAQPPLTARILELQGAIGNRGGGRLLRQVAPARRRPPRRRRRPRPPPGR